MSNELRSDMALARQIKEFIDESESIEKASKELTARRSTLDNKEIELYLNLKSTYGLTKPLTFQLSNTRCVEFRCTSIQNKTLEYRFLDLIPIVDVHEELPAQFGEVIE